MSSNQSLPKEYSESLVWTKTKEATYPYYYVDDEDTIFRVRINDFPEEPFYTLLKEGKALMSFNDWPDNWKIK